MNENTQVEPVEPEYVCGKCRKPVYRDEGKYCPNCGSELRWSA